MLLLLKAKSQPKGPTFSQVLQRKQLLPSTNFTTPRDLLPMAMGSQFLRKLPIGHWLRCVPVCFFYDPSSISLRNRGHRWRSLKADGSAPSAPRLPAMDPSSSIGSNTSGRNPPPCQPPPPSMLHINDRSCLICRRPRHPPLPLQHPRAAVTWSPVAPRPRSALAVEP